MTEKMERYEVVAIEPLILTIRGQKVILDEDLARIYGVATKNFNRAVKRNADRFPSDFVFQLTAEEYGLMRCQNGTSKPIRGGRRYLPYAFTEHGAIMAATILNTPHAVQMSVFVVRAFVKMRALLVSQKDLSRKLAGLEKKVTERLDLHERAIGDIIQQIMLLLNPPPSEPEPPKKKIGFLVEDRHAPYKSLKQSKVKISSKKTICQGMLAERMIQSLGDMPLTEVEEAWVKEAERRFAVWRRGQKKGVPAKKAFKQIRKDLNW